MKGGRTLNDRKLAADVRTLGLKKIKAILEDDTKKGLQFQILMKLAPTLLPRIQEVTGEDGEAIRIDISKDIADKNEVAFNTINRSEGLAQI
jgi:hypothetical protein